MDMEIDPEIAAAMGFGSFGGAPKKRKFGAFLWQRFGVRDVLSRQANLVSIHVLQRRRFLTCG
jgi:hypothetical protein